MRIEEEVVVDGRSIGTFTFRFDTAPERGPRMTCTAEQYIRAEDGVPVHPYSTFQVVHLP
jgi:hypothetical protein